MHSGAGGCRLFTATPASAPAVCREDDRRWLPPFLPLPQQPSSDQESWQAWQRLAGVLPQLVLALPWWAVRMGAVVISGVGDWSTSLGWEGSCVVTTSADCAWAQNVRVACRSAAPNEMPVISISLYMYRLRLTNTQSIYLCILLLETIDCAFVNSDSLCRGHSTQLHA